MLSPGVKRLILGGKKVVAADSVQALAFLARTVGLDAPHISAYKALINGLVTDGVWTKLDALYVFATQDPTTSLLNLVSSSFSATVNTGAPAFAADRGYTSLVGNSLTTNFNASTAGGNYAQNSAHIMLWNNATTVGDSNCQVDASASEAVYARFSDTNAYFRIQNGSAGGFTTTTAHGFYLANRSAAGAWQGYKDTAQLGTGTDASSALSNSSFFVPAESGGNTPSADQVSAVGFGGSLSPTDAANYNSRMRAYMTTVGVP